MTRCAKRSYGKDFTTSSVATLVTPVLQHARADIMKSEFLARQKIVSWGIFSPLSNILNIIIFSHFRLLLPFEKSRKGQEFNKYMPKEKEKKKGKFSDEKRDKNGELYIPIFFMHLCYAFLTVQSYTKRSLSEFEFSIIHLDVIRISICQGGCHLLIYIIFFLQQMEKIEVTKMD